METGIDKAKLLQYKASLAKALGEPAKMRLAVVAGFLLVGIALVYYPLSDQIEQKRLQLSAEQKRAALIQEVEAIRKQVALYRPHIGEHSDTNEWVQFLLAGSRSCQVRLRNMESREPQTVGPYKAVCLAVELEGTYPQLKAFVEWLEQTDRLLRVDTVRFEKMPNALIMKVYILGLIKRNA